MPGTVDAAGKRQPGPVKGSGRGSWEGAAQAAGRPRPSLSPKVNQVSSLFPERKRSSFRVGLRIETGEFGWKPARIYTHEMRHTHGGVPAVGLQQPGSSSRGSLVAAPWPVKQQQFGPVEATGPVEGSGVRPRQREGQGRSSVSKGRPGQQPFSREKRELLSGRPPDRDWRFWVEAGPNLYPPDETRPRRCACCWPAAATTVQQ